MGTHGELAPQVDLQIDVMTEPLYLKKNSSRSFIYQGQM